MRRFPIRFEAAFVLFNLALIGAVNARVSSRTSASTTEDPVGDFRHLLPQAELEPESVLNIPVQLGGTAFLPCIFRQTEELKISDDQVSWFRRRDWHILTTGMLTYTTDQRFSVLHPDGSDDWTLQIKYVTKRDNGTYECQLSTGTGVISQFVNLKVVIPKAVILGGPEYHVELGSSIKLICVIDQIPTPPQFVFWYHNDRMINYDNRRGGINVSSESGAKTKSYLTIGDATYEDSGNYSCSASNTEVASTNVFVSFGDKMAAILRRKSSNAVTINHENLQTIVLLMLFQFFMCDFSKRLSIVVLR